MGARPSWQQDDCSAWCEGDHHEDDQPVDCTHHSGGISVPVVTREQSISGGQLYVTIDAGDFEIGLTRMDGQADTWLYIGGGAQQHIEITTESARRVETALRRLWHVVSLAACDCPPFDWRESTSRVEVTILPRFGAIRE